MMRKVLLTGGTGMVGRNIVDRFREAGVTIEAPSRATMNLFDGDAVKAYLAESRPDMIVHAAGTVGGIQANVAAPTRFLAENTQIGLNIILAARDAGVPHFLNIASSCIYPRNRQTPLREEEILTGELEPTNEGYALAKITATRLCEYISSEFANFCYRTLIPCNLYGRYDKFDDRTSHMIPAVIRKISEAVRTGGPSVEIWGDGAARREFMYAGDLADFVFFAADRMESLPQNLNVGLGYDYSINEYYEAVAKVLDYRGAFEHNLKRPVGMSRKLVSVDKLTALGWRAETSLMAGIEKTCAFYREGVLK